MRQVVIPSTFRTIVRQTPQHLTVAQASSLLGAKRWPVLDRHGKRLHVGDKIRAQVLKWAWTAACRFAPITTSKLTSCGADTHTTTSSTDTKRGPRSWRSFHENARPHSERRSVHQHRSR